MTKIVLIALLAAVALFTFAACNRPQAESLSGQYFVRCARYDTKGGQLIVIDPNSPRVITMDDWPQLVFTSADGQHTIQRLCDTLALKYGKSVPSGLDRQVKEVVQQLVSEKLIRLSPTPVAPPHYLSVPVSEQDPQQSLAEMEKDGFIRK